MRRFLRTACLLAAFFPGTVLWAQRPITLDDFLNGERVSGVALSHDGNYVLEHFTVTDGPKTQRHALVKRLPDGVQVARFDSVRVEWMPRTEALLLHQGDSLVRIDPVTDARTVLARINRNNYVFLHIPYGKSYRGMNLYRINQFFFEHFDAEWVYNLDGGYSSSLYYCNQPQKKNAALTLVVPHTQKVADVLCITE